MSMFYIVFSIAFILSLSINLYHWVNKPDVSIKTALDKLKTSMVRMIVFYQNQYNASDNIVLIKKWMDSIKIDEVPKWQLKLFKDYVDRL